MAAVQYFDKYVDKIIFGLLSPKMIKKMACVKIVTPELYDKEGYPVDGGLMDVRLGVIDPGLRCKTCGGKLKECLGHFGYIELARPVFHVKYISVVTKLLQCTCSSCGRVLLSEEEIQKLETKVRKADKRGAEFYRKVVKAIRNSIKAKKCPHCKKPQYQIKLEKPTTIIENNKRLNPMEVRARLEKIPDRDLYILGLKAEYARPEWMILTVFPIPPVTMRPSITLESGERAEDDLTHKLGDIVRINQRLFENINAGAPEVIIEDLWDLLQYHITTYFDNEISQLPPARHRSGQPLKTISERIKSKEGRFRHNLAGKRVNYAARTVISPDPMIKINEVGVPIEVAKELTIPEKVTEWNIEWLKGFIKRGPENYPGANYVIDDTGKKRKISPETKEQLLKELKPGYIVERHIINGDISIFNRQPSLHRMSIMGHRVRVLPGKSFRMNPAVCAPYNADFDGDEMNLHIPQTEEARAEAEVLMEIPTQIMSPKHGVNVIGCIEDAITGNYLLTKEMSFSKEEAISLLVSVGIEDKKKFKKFKNVVEGKEIFSVALPEDFSFIGQNKAGEKVVIKNGKLVSGAIDDKIIGEGGGTLIRDLFRVYGADFTADFIDKIFKLGIAVLEKRGFTITIADADLPEDVVKRTKEEIEQSLKDVDKLIEKKEKGKLEAYPSKTVEETLEFMILKRLNEARNKIGLMILKRPSENNNILIMSQCGAKGNILHLVQISALIGQQALRGERIKIGYKDRTLPLFKKGDISPAARGFVRHNFKKGINPPEFFFHAMTGRDSLMDTALRTPRSGYLYRRLANATQDLKVEYDYTVRDASGTIIQFKYGEDNIDVSKSEKGTIDTEKIVEEVIEK